MESITSALNPLNIKYVYAMFGGKKREKLDLILEPLQAMIQLSMLSCCPIGSKRNQEKCQCRTTSAGGKFKKYCH